MPPVAPPPRVRRFVRPAVYVGISTVLLLITAVAVGEARSFEESFQAQRRADIEARLTEFVKLTESRVLGELFRPLLDDMGRAEDLAALETRWRADPRVDALYMWDRDELVYPTPAIEVDVAALRAEPCMQVPAEAVGDPVATAEAYARCYDAPDPQLALFALTESLELLLDAEHAAVATEHLRRSRLYAVGQGRVRGLDVRLLAGVQLLAARERFQAGRSEISQNWTIDLAKEIARLDGPELERTIDLTEFPIPQDLRAYGLPGEGLPDEVDEMLRRARRRLALWEELEGVSVAGPSTPGPSDHPRVIVDPLDDPPWLLYVSRLGMGELYGAVQVDQAELIRSVLAEGDARFLSIRDANGRVLRGTSDEAFLEVPFPHLFPHLHLVLGKSAISTGGASPGVVVRRFGPFAAAIAIGLFALWALIRADRQQELLLERQRDFVARVSHELKTPLAGIRLMAENLEIGAFRDDAQREAFARRIVQEAERLTARVNEVIRAATRPEDDVPVDTDVDAMLAELAASWQPRMQAVGATLTVEAERIGTMRVMPVLLRDALTNLLDNAFKYRKADTGGHVWLRARRQGRVLTFEVEDDGLGVPVGQRRSIFDRFRRVEGAGRGKAGGHGLGLSFVAETARLHGGRVECLDGVAGGARFILRIKGKS